MTVDLELVSKYIPLNLTSETPEFYKFSENLLVNREIVLATPEFSLDVRIVGEYDHPYEIYRP